MAASLPHPGTRDNVHVLPWALNWAKAGSNESDLALVILAIALRQAGESTAGIAGLLCRTAAMRAASMGRESLSNEDKEAWVEDHEQLRQFMSSVDTGEEGGEGGSFRWLVPLPEPDIEAVILNYCRRGGSSPSHLDELEQDLDRTLAEINQIEEEYLLAHPTATPLMRNEHGTPVLFFHRKTPTRSILRLLAEIRGRIDGDCDYIFPPAPGSSEMSILLDLVRVALR